MRHVSLLLLFLPLSALLFSCSASRKQSEVEHDPDTALEALLAGNHRFVHGKSKHPHQSHHRILETEGAQHPFAVIVTCSDSRVPPEILFDEGIGDLFVIRTAGNLMSDLELGSIEYAVEHLHAKLVVVLGHTECGAVKAFIEGGEACGHVKNLVDALAAEREEQDIVLHEGKDLNACIEGNILHGVNQLEHDEPVLTHKIKAGELKVLPMLYDVHTGKVELLKSLELRKKHHIAEQE